MQCCLCCIHHIQFTGVMEVSLPEGEWLEEISSDALDRFVQNQSGYAEGFVRFMPSGQVIEKYDFDKLSFNFNYNLVES